MLGIGLVAAAVVVGFVLMSFYALTKKFDVKIDVTLFRILGIGFQAVKPLTRLSQGANDPEK